MSRDDWPSESYAGAMMADLRRKGTAPPRRRIIGYRETENVTEEQRQRNKEIVKLNARQRQLLAYLESGRTLSAPRYAKGYIGERLAIRRLCRLGVWREVRSFPVHEDDPLGS